MLTDNPSSLADSLCGAGEGATFSGINTALRQASWLAQQKEATILSIDEAYGFGQQLLIKCCFAKVNFGAATLDLCQSLHPGLAPRHEGAGQAFFLPLDIQAA